jgi:hypothetical protein
VAPLIAVARSATSLLAGQSSAAAEGLRDQAQALQTLLDRLQSNKIRTRRRPSRG